MHRYDIDALKGLAIIAVVLFHLGILKSGYLGVDLFFVINGFLVIPSVIKHIGNSSFSYFDFLLKKLIRFLPLVSLASIVSLVLGYFLMLPDHYESLSQSVIAGNAMSENILSAITTKNYWDVSNEFKPLMHLWYLGILFEFYIFFPLVMIICKVIADRIKTDSIKIMRIGLLIICLISFSLYLMPIGSTGDRFYYLHYRLFEIGVGGIVALYFFNNKSEKTYSKYIQPISVLFLILLMSCSLFSFDKGSSVPVIGSSSNLNNGLPISSDFALLLTVLFGCFAVSYSEGSHLLKSRLLRWIGQMSYSIFIWHQVIIAFYRYSISYDMSIQAYVSLIALSIIIAILSFYFVEKKITTTRKSILVWLFIAFVSIIPSIYIYICMRVLCEMYQNSMSLEEQSTVECLESIVIEFMITIKIFQITTKKTC